MYLKIDFQKKWSKFQILSSFKLNYVCSNLTRFFLTKSEREFYSPVVPNYLIEVLSHAYLGC